MSTSIFGYLKSLKLQATRTTPTSTMMGLVVRVVGSITAVVTGGTFTLIGATASANTRVAATGASQTLLGANAARKGATIFVDHATNSALVLFGATASSTAFNVKILAGGYYEVPFGYTGRIDAIMSAASGDFAVGELT